MNQYRCRNTNNASKTLRTKLEGEKEKREKNSRDISTKSLNLEYLYTLYLRDWRCCHLPAVFFSGHNHFTSTASCQFFFFLLLFLSASCFHCVASALTSEERASRMRKRAAANYFRGHGPINPFNGVKFNSPGKERGERRND